MCETLTPIIFATIQDGAIPLREAIPALAATRKPEMVPSMIPTKRRDSFGKLVSFVIKLIDMVIE